MTTAKTTKISWVVAGVFALAVIYFAFIKPAPPPTIKERTVYLPGKTDTLFIPGVPDTITKFVPFPVYVSTTPPVEQFGADSSQYKIETPEGSKAQVTTFPATDSIRVEIEPVQILREITRIDTLKLTTVDTIRVETITEIEQPWYNTFMFGAITTAVLTIGGLLAL
ncbi:MAG: hypothetical protein H3C48_00670 [Chitinophagaceae bacterium]|nr:hypothetical protein [Chitinophagaceae bacterium]